MDGLLAHDEFNECNVPHTGCLFTKPEPQSHSFPTHGKITAGEEVLPGRMVVISQRLDRRNQCVQAERSKSLRASWKTVKSCYRGDF